MKLIHFVSFMATASLAQTPYHLENIHFECKPQACYLDLSFKDSKFNPTITQKHPKATELFLELGQVQSPVDLDTTLVFHGNKIQQLNIQTHFAHKSVQFKFNLKGQEIKSFSKISKLNDKTVRFEIPVKAEKTTSSTLALKEPSKDVKFQALPPTTVKTPISTTTTQPKTSLSRTAEKVLFDHFLKNALQNTDIPKTAQSFSLNAQVIPMNLIADANLYELPQSNSKILAKGSLGKMVDRIQIKNNWVQVRTKSGLLAYVERNKLAYSDELKPEQVQKISSLYAKNPEKKFDFSTDSTTNSNLKSTMDSSKIILAQNQEKTERFVYSSFGRRDPFIRVKLPEVEGLSIDDIQLVGIIWSESDPIAIFEDKKMPDRSYSLRKGDPVMNGSVQKISQNSVVFNKNEFGVNRQFMMTLPKEQQ